MPTIYDVAAEAGVAISTVSRVLNNKDRVSDKTREKVLKAIEKLNFKPNFIGQSLGRSDSRHILVILPSYGDSLAAEYTKGISEVLYAENYDYFISYNALNSRDSNDYRHYIESGLVGGCIIIRQSGTKLPPQMPTVYVEPDGNAAYSVTSNTYSACQNIVSRLVTRGKRHFAFIHSTSPDGTPISYSQSRFEYIQKALSNYKLSCEVHSSPNLPASKTFHQDYTYINSLKIAESYASLALSDRPDAIICAYDSIALAFAHTFQRHNIRIPQETAIASFDNSPLTCYAQPQITSVQNPYYDFGKESAKMLLNVIRGEITGGRQLTLNPVLIERGSTDPSLP